MPGDRWLSAAPRFAGPSGPQLAEMKIYSILPAAPAAGSSGPPDWAEATLPGWRMERSSARARRIRNPFRGPPRIFANRIMRDRYADCPISLLLRIHGRDGGESPIASRGERESYAIISWRRGGFAGNGRKVLAARFGWSGADCRFARMAVSERPIIACKILNAQRTRIG